jgi:hypothetical protein
MRPRAEALRRSTVTPGDGHRVVDVSRCWSVELDRLTSTRCRAVERGDDEVILERAGRPAHRAQLRSAPPVPSRRVNSSPGRVVRRPRRASSLELRGHRHRRGSARAMPPGNQPAGASANGSVDAVARISTASDTGPGRFLQARSSTSHTTRQSGTLFFPGRTCRADHRGGEPDGASQLPAVPSGRSARARPCTRRPSPTEAIAPYNTYPRGGSVDAGPVYRSRGSSRIVR